MKTFAIIPSGGSGKRIGNSIPKQYIKVNDKEILAHTIQIFQDFKGIDEIIVAAQPEYFILIENLKNDYKFTKLSKIIQGGAERQDSVYNALNSLICEKNDLIVIHDAARPLLSAHILNNSINLALKHDNITVAIKAKDTLLKGNEKVESYLDRNEIFYVQTPQIFRFESLKSAMDKAYNENFYGTDESMLLKRAGFEVFICEGSTLNFKITTQDDLNTFKKVTNI